MPGLVLELLAFFLLVLGFYRYYRDLKSHIGPEEAAGEQGEEAPPAG
jgi:hypothetical protein